MPEPANGPPQIDERTDRRSLIKAFIAGLTVSLSEQDLLAWGRRIAFLRSAVLVAFGLWIRLRELLAGVLSRIPTTVLHLGRGQVLSAILVGSACRLALIPLAGAVSDGFKRRVVYGIAAAGGGVWPCSSR